MPIAAPIVAAGIGAAAGIGGGLIASSASKSAAKTAANAANSAATQNNALQREIYQSNIGLAEPWRQGGLQAFNTTNALLGLPAPPPQQQSAPQGYGGTPNALNGSYGGNQAIFDGFDGQYAPQMYGQPQPVQQQAQPAITPGQAFDTFRNSDGYQFRFNQGMDALNKGYAANGTLQSGAAVKAALRYGQDYGSGEFGKYLGYLGNQQGVGLSANNAIMGVGTNYANQVGQNNDSAASAVGNAALASGGQQANLWGNTIPNALGSAFGRPNVFGSSYSPSAFTVNSLRPDVNSMMAAHPGVF